MPVFACFWLKYACFACYDDEFFTEQAWGRLWLYD